MGELVASIAHEVNSAASAVITNSDAALRWLGRWRSPTTTRWWRRCIGELTPPWRRG